MKTNLDREPRPKTTTAQATPDLIRRTFDLTATNAKVVRFVVCQPR